MTSTRTAFHVCPLCEATCGLELTLEGDRVVGVRGDADDVFSAGFVCPKGVAIADLHEDPARLRTPMVRDGAGVLRPATWDEAYDRIRLGLGELYAAYGADALAVYLGNPNVHNVTSTFYVPALVRALGTRYRFSASTVDQMPQQVALGLMYGTELSVPVPDVDRTDLFVVFGGNPLVSNGSMMTAPDMPRRVRDLRSRGGRLVVVDPVRTRTAAAADEHIGIRPGTDVLMLAAMVHVVLATGADLGAAAPHVDPADLGALRGLVAPFTPAAVAPATGVDAATIERLARDVAGAPSAAVYGRMGTTTAGLPVDGVPTSFGTVASWLVAVLNVVTGNLDRPGGVMFPLPPAGGPTTAGEPGRGRGIRIPGSQRTRVRGLPSVLGEFPVAALAEEIDTPDPATGARVRALLTVAGNPLASTPDAGRLAAALDSLDLLVCVDAYLSDTAARADVVLPVPSPLERSHYDVVFASLAVRDTARWSPALLEGAGPDEGEVLLTLAAIAAGALARASGAEAVEPTAEQLDDLVAYEVARRACADPASRGHGREPAALLAAVAPRRGVERLLDLSLRAGPYGDGFGAHPEGLSLAALEAAPHGIDLGALKPRLPEVLRTPTGRIEIVPEQLAAEMARLTEALPRVTPPDLVLVGRRQLRSNNSWLRTLPRLTGGSNRCTLQVHPDDAVRTGVADGARAVLSSAAGSVTVDVEVSDVVRPGVVCLPHGWGPVANGAWGPAAGPGAGANVNVLTPGSGIDALAGTAVLNGVPVTLVPC